MPSYQIFSITLHTIYILGYAYIYILIVINTHARNIANLEKIVYPPWFEDTPLPHWRSQGGGHWPLLGVKSVKYPAHMK